MLGYVKRKDKNFPRFAVLEWSPSAPPEGGTLRVRLLIFTKRSAFAGKRASRSGALRRDKSRTPRGDYAGGKSL